MTDLAGRIVLIIDDNPINLGVIADYLEEYNFEIITALNGQDGLEKAHHEQPDIILLDIMMPGIDGFEVCRRLKTDEATRDIPVIFMTALAGEEDKVKGFDAGAVDYITKPVQQREALARVTTHLRIRDQAKRLEEQANELTELNANKDKFFSIVAHDLKGPFMPLIGNAELLMEMADTLTPPEIYQMGASIHNSPYAVDNLTKSPRWLRICNP